MLSSEVLQAIAAINNIVAENFSKDLSDLRRKNVVPGRSETMLEIFFFPQTSQEVFENARSHIRENIKKYLPGASLEQIRNGDQMCQIYLGIFPEGFKYVPSLGTELPVIMVYFNIPKEKRSYDDHRVWYRRASGPKHGVFSLCFSCRQIFCKDFWYQRKQEKIFRENFWFGLGCNGFFKYFF